jgi:Na+-driven multidrug efflux pump
LGAQDAEGARRCARQANLLGLGIMSLWGAAFVLFPHAWVSFFTSDPAVLVYSVPLMTVMGILQPPLAVAMVISGALRGAGETHVVLAAAILGGWCVRLPLAYAAGIAGGLGITAVWTTMLLDWVVRSGIVSWRFRRLRLTEVRL